MLITKIEAKEACDWLRAAGFPQYVQLFRDCRFPVDTECAKHDHHFLDKDALDAMCRRLTTLNKCVDVRLEPRRAKRRGDDRDDEDFCAISPNWTYDRRMRRWRRLDSSSDSPADSQDVSLCDVSDRHDACSTHSSSSTDSEAHSGHHKTDGEPGAVTVTTDDQETSRSSSCCSSVNKTPSLGSSISGPPSPCGSGGGVSIMSLEAEGCFLDKPPRKKCSGLLRKMEKLRLRGPNALLPSGHISESNSSGWTRHIVGPVLIPEEHPSSLQGCRSSRTSSSPPTPHTVSSSSNSQSESSSTISTPSPVTRVRSNCKRSSSGAGPTRDHQSHTGSQAHRNQTSSSLVFQIPEGHKPGTFPTSLAHKLPITSPIVDSTSVNWRTGSFHGYRHTGHRGASSASPLAALDHRLSIYDNVPDRQQLSESDADAGSDTERTREESEASRLLAGEDVFSALDNVLERISNLQQLVTTWSENLSEDDSQRSGSSSSSSSSTSPDSPSHGSSATSPRPSSPCHIHLEVQHPEEEEEEEEAEAESCDKWPANGEEPKTKLPKHRSRGRRRLHGSSEQSLPPRPPSPAAENQSVSQVVLLRKLSLLKLTSLMDKHSPSSKQGWNWSVPKTLRKTKLVEVKGQRVFGVPLLLNVQQTGAPLPPSILRALVYLRTRCLNQVGLFRKSGVKSRIQCLRQTVESDPDGVSYDGQSAFDVADMVKQYFRDLPEPVFSSKLCESFLHIYQYFPKDQQLVAAQAAMLLLPDENREALRTLLFFLRDVVACVDENQMTPTNIAVCLAPSLFHLNTVKRDSKAARSSHSKYSLGRPDQRDLSENLAATQGLANMITEAQRLFQLPEFWPGQSMSSAGARVGGSPAPPRHSGAEVEQEERRTKLQQSTQQLLKEAREKSRGWESHPAPEPVELASKKMDDGCPLWMWRGSVEVDAPQNDLLHRLLMQQELWEGNLHQAAVVQALSPDSDVYLYLLQSPGHGQGLVSRPPQQHLLLRTWQADPSSGPLYLSSVSTEHAEVPVEGIRVHVSSCLYLLEPTGHRKTHLTHVCRTDTRDRSHEWHSSASGSLLASGLMAIRDSFRPDYEETKI